MPTSPHLSCERTAEVTRLVGLARAILSRPEEEIVVNYLDHALDALQIVSEGEFQGKLPATSPRALKVRTMEQAEDLG